MIQMIMDNRFLKKIHHWKGLLRGIVKVPEFLSSYVLFHDDINIESRNNKSIKFERLKVQLYSWSNFISLSFHFWKFH